MSKTVFTQYDPFETLYTCQSDVWRDDVKSFFLRPMGRLIVVHPFPFASEYTTLQTDSAHLSFAKICIDDSCFSPDLHKEAPDVEQETEERNVQQRSICHRNQSGHVESTGFSPVLFIVIISGIAASIGTSNFQRPFFMVCLNSSSSRSMKNIPRNCLALSSFGFSKAHVCFAFFFAASDICLHISGYTYSGRKFVCFLVSLHPDHVFRQVAFHSIE